MKRIQVIGLPGSGKTKAINLYKDRTHLGVLSLLDIRNFNREYNFKDAILKASTNLIAESVCGVNIPDTYVIKLHSLTKPRDVASFVNVGDKLLINKSINTHYISYLDQQMIPANYTVNSSEQLCNLLDHIFKI